MQPEPQSKKITMLNQHTEVFFLTKPPEQLGLAP